MTSFHDHPPYFVAVSFSILFFPSLFFGRPLRDATSNRAVVGYYLERLHMDACHALQLKTGTEGKPPVNPSTGFSAVISPSKTHESWLNSNFEKRNNNLFSISSFWCNGFSNIPHFFRLQSQFHISSVGNKKRALRTACQSSYLLSKFSMNGHVADRNRLIEKCGLRSSKMARMPYRSTNRAWTRVTWEKYDKNKRWPKQNVGNQTRKSKSDWEYLTDFVRRPIRFPTRSSMCR